MGPVLAAVKKDAKAEVYAREVDKCVAMPICKTNLFAYVYLVLICVNIRSSCEK